MAEWRRETAQDRSRAAWVDFITKTVLMPLVVMGGTFLIADYIDGGLFDGHAYPFTPPVE